MAPSVKVRLEVEGAPEAVATVRAFANQSKAAGREASTGFGGLGNALSGVTKLFAAYKLAQASVQLGRFTLDTVRLAAEQKDLALSLGTTIRNMSTLSAVAKVTNTEQAKLVAGLGALGDRIKGLREGAPEAVRGFRQLGLSAKDFASDDIVENAARVAEALEKVARGGNRGALATQALGKNGRALLPVFERLNELGGLAGAARLAEQLGILVDARTVATLEQVAQQMQLIEASARGLALELARGFGPQLLVALEGLKRLLVENRPEAEAFGRAIGYLARGVAELVVHTVAWGVVLGDVFTFKFAKAREDFERFDRLLKDMRSGQAPAGGSINDAVGAPAVDEAARAAARVRVAQRLEDLERRLFTETARVEEIANAERYRKGEISLETYYANRAKIITRALQRELAQVKAQLDNPAVIGDRRALLQREASVLDQQIAALELENTAALDSAREKARNFGTELRDNVGKALTDFLTNGINGVRSLSDAFAQLGRVIANAVQQTAGQWLTTALFSFLPGAPTKKAAGGLISGPGTGTSDSIPAWVSAGEYIVRAAAVRQPGMLSHLEALNSGRFQELVRQNLSYQMQPRRYADGGLVEQSPLAGGSSSVGGSIQIGLDDGLILRALESPAGQRVLLKVVARSPRAFGAAIRR